MVQLPPNFLHMAVNNLPTYPAMYSLIESPLVYFLVCVLIKITILVEIPSRPGKGNCLYSKSPLVINVANSVSKTQLLIAKYSICCFQTYEHILGNVYEVPAEISENAKDFIGKLLHPDPQERGDLEPTSTDSIFNHKFLKTYPKQGPESKKKDIQE